MTQPRSSSRVRPRALAVMLGFGLALLAIPTAKAQYWFGYQYGGIYPGYAGIFPAYTGIYPAYTGITPAYTGITPAYTGLPGFGVYDYGFYDPYAWYNDWAVADTLGLASAGMASARYDLESASSASVASANYLMNKAAQQEMLWQRSLSGNATPIPRYGVRSGRSSSSGRPNPQNLVTQTSREGDVLWPVSSPSQGDLFEKRRDADQAIKAVVRDYRSKGVAPVDEVVAAIRALHAYVDPAVASLRKERPQDLESFLGFAEGLHSGLRGLAPQPPKPDEGPASGAPKAETPKR